ncbi:MAG: phenylacetate-CoA oxygenase subunit PaaC [Bacteroidetes bacterium]|nr:phenylacetate-CoA oxygenase subunit PaaC [Bacteroidota bacterium]
MSSIDYTLHLADNALILGHRNSEWTGHGPILEQDIALSNIALDLIGQARYLYQYAARQTGKPEVTEDSLAFLRDAWDYRNCLLVEQANGDWGKTILRQFFFSAYQFFFYERLQHSTDNELAAIAEKSLKEVTYHLRWSSEWTIRLGDGTEESNRRMRAAMDQLWKFTGELFIPASYEKIAAAVDLSSIKPLWEERVSEVLLQARLEKPAAGWGQTGGKEGRHTEELGYLLAEMQFLQRAYPGNEW